jgi:hypothetical protein
LLQDLISFKETKCSIGQANYDPNLVIVPDTSHIQIAPNLNGSSPAKSTKGIIQQGYKVFLVPTIRGPLTFWHIQQ